MTHPEYETLRGLLNRQLALAMPEALCEENDLYAVMRYGIGAAGKRLRGVLVLIFCDRLGISRTQSIPFAVALEMIHAYSLVHDDMPEMDNDDFRRGLPACHRQFGPAMALLGGDGILNYSMEYLLKQRKFYQPERFLNALSKLYRASGGHGMLGGQVLDKKGEKKQITLDQLICLHQHKTGALLQAPALIAEALSARKENRYVNYCAHIGLAFQIKDDLLDVEGDRESLGKEPGKDEKEHKSTFVSLLGLAEARACLEKEINAACTLVQDDALLLFLARYIESREN